MQGGAIFAPAYSAPPPEGKFVRISLHASSASEACAQYREDFGSGSELLFTRVTTNGYGVGRYEVVEQLRAGDTPQAQVRVIESANGVKANTYTASSGYLELDSLPGDVDAWQRGERARGHLKAVFSVDPIVSSSCDSSGSKNGSVARIECTCVTASGLMSQCQPEVDEVSCCSASAPASLVYETDLAAEPCSFLCAYTDAKLAAYCLELE